MTVTTDRTGGLGDLYMNSFLKSDPFTATLLGIKDYDSYCPATGPESTAARIDELYAQLERVRTADSCTEVKVLERLIVNEIGKWEHGTTDMSISAGIAAPQSQIMGMVSMTSTESNGAAYLDRLAGVGACFDGWLARHRTACNEGRTPTARGVRGAIDQLDSYLSTPIDRDRLVGPIAALRDPKIRSKAESIVAGSIRPALARYREGIAELLSSGRSDEQAGLCNIPGGEAAYADAVGRHAMPALSPAEIHRIGLETVASLRDELAVVGRAALNITDVSALLQVLREDTKLRFTDGAEMVKFADQALSRARAATHKWIPDYGIPDCRTEPIDPIEALSAPMAYYQPPSEDGSRPGTHRINTASPQTCSRYEYEALTFHESVPGHHMQIASSQRMHTLPKWRRYLGTSFTSYVEGWALYSERLAEDMGLYSSDLQRLGMLSLASFRACRLVIDTGLHHFGWSRERAMTYMRENTATNEINIANEIDRYIAQPGQAVAYMIGYLELARLRRDAKRRLGASFDVVAFHGQILGQGPLPIDILATDVEEWIDERIRELT